MCVCVSQNDASAFTDAAARDSAARLAEATAQAELASQEATALRDQVTDLEHRVDMLVAEQESLRSQLEDKDTMLRQSNMGMDLAKERAVTAEESLAAATARQSQLQDDGTAACPASSLHCARGRESDRGWCVRAPQWTP